ncbi:MULTISPECIES: DUF2937 family protein [unclassified Rhizobium]|uniref:DUF2937 family protein n=1 Tax=unclassified Rhizobium TaxID=2613769 RepID=UPI001AEA6A4F|nr:MULTISPECIES: DUF2937 family protein [unclassified Rhizobium]MBP2462543.1 hypothetical protein [Rhizobium sp. PvP014]MBP2529937.1 hypothetical protein [Rhizobium sp. PvP099]
MLMFGRMLTMAAAILGGLFFSQAPEFAQQYRQRIGGAFDELKVMITQFDTQANHHGLGRQEALNVYSSSPETFLRDQGDTMRGIFQRYETLLTQQDELIKASLPIKPFVVMRNADPMTFTNTWRDYVPAVPIDAAGLTWAGGGFFAGWVAAGILGFVLKGATRPFRTNRGSKQATPQV